MKIKKMKIKKYNALGKLDRWLGEYFNIMALVRTVGVIIVMWSLI